MHGADARVPAVMPNAGERRDAAAYVTHQVCRRTLAASHNKRLGIGYNVCWFVKSQTEGAGWVLRAHHTFTVCDTQHVHVQG